MLPLSMNAELLEPYVLLRRRLTFYVPVGIAAFVGVLATDYIPSRQTAALVSIFCCLLCLAAWTHVILTFRQILKWPCPGCGKTFAASAASLLPADHCKHCGFSAEPHS